MSCTALYKAFIEVGASEDGATKAAEDVIQVSQLPQLATKADIALLKRKGTDFKSVPGRNSGPKPLGTKYPGVRVKILTNFLL